MNKVYKMKKRLLFCFVSLWFFSVLGCTNSIYDSEMKKAIELKKKHSTTILFDGDREPVDIDLDKNNSDLLGVDTNNNDVRDDLEIWANRIVSTPNARRVIKQLAKAQTGVIRAMLKNDKEAIKNSVIEMDNVIMCEGFLLRNGLISNADDVQFSKFSQSLIDNTSIRIEFERKLSREARTIQTPFLAEKEKCSFNIEQ